MPFIPYGFWQDVCHSGLNFCLYIAFGAGLLLILRRLIRIPDFVFRKLLHFVAFSCLVLLIACSHSWKCASFVSLLFALIVYPILKICEHLPGFSRFLVEKKPGEIRSSLVQLFGMAALIFAIAWGIFGRKDLAAASILMWGAGDGAAALVGIPFGRHKIDWKHTDHQKSWEGVWANFCVELLICFVILQAQASPLPAAALLVSSFQADFLWIRSLLISLAAAGCGAMVELFSKKGYDTFTVPLSLCLVLCLLCQFSI